MFDIGFLELLIIGIVALIIVGPKDLPGMFRTVGRFMGKARAMAREFQRSMEEAADESGLKDAGKALRDVDNIGLNSATKSAKSYAKDFVTGRDAPKESADPQAEASETATVKAPAKPAPEVTTTPKPAEVKSPGKAAEG